MGTEEVGANSYTNWDFYNKHIDTNLNQGKFISSETTLIAAGYPSLDGTPGRSKVTYADTGEKDAEGKPITVKVPPELNQVYPIGLLETISVQQSKQIQRIFELGSARSYFIPGRVIGSFNLGRTFFNGSSLLRVLYAYTGIDHVDGNTDPLIRTNPLSPGDEETTNLKRIPGQNEFFIDLTSDLFARPFGMAIYCKDSYGRTSNAFFLENCYIQGHQLSISAGSLIIMEGASAQFERAAPIKIQSVDAFQA